MKLPIPPRGKLRRGRGAWMISCWWILVALFLCVSNKFPTSLSFQVPVPSSSSTSSSSSPESPPETGSSSSPSTFAESGRPRVATIDDETLPELVLEYAQQREQEGRRQGVKRRQPTKTASEVKDGLLFWTDRLDVDIHPTDTSQQTFRNETNSSKNITSNKSLHQSTDEQVLQRSHQSSFSLMTWNILSQPLYNIQAVKNFAASYPSSSTPSSSSTDSKYQKFSWEERLEWILNRIASANPDILCLQEVDFDTYYQDLEPALQLQGYQAAVQGALDGSVREIKRRKGKGERAHVIATFWKTEKFIAEEHLARGRTLTSLLRQSLPCLPTVEPSPLLAVINCHLEGHPRQYGARLRQLEHAMDDLVTRAQNRAGNPNEAPPPRYNGLVLAGDMNCELESSACSTYLKMGRVGRRGGLGGVHGTSANAVPPFLLETEEAASCLDPIVEWGTPIPEAELEKVPPHAFRRNSLQSVYPPTLGKSNPLHYTFCANPQRPVSGLDQIWYSSYTLQPHRLLKPLSTIEERKAIISTGLPLPGYPSDHLPIGAIWDWYDDSSSAKSEQRPSSHADSTPTIRELIIAQDKPPPAPKTKSPIMAYAELDLLMVTCPYDSPSQQEELEWIIDQTPKDLPTNPKQKPSSEQLKTLSELRKRRKRLLDRASAQSREVLQRILKLSKEVTAYESEQQQEEEARRKSEQESKTTTSTREEGEPVQAVPR